MLALILLMDQLHYDQTEQDKYFLTLVLTMAALTQTQLSM